MAHVARRVAALAVLLPFLPGCGPYATMQAELAGQGREGLRRVEAARQAESDAVAKFLLDRRRRLDVAFDTDVRGQEMLDADWVIEARRAYGIALEALAEQRAAHAVADERSKDNAAAADEALALLERMLRTQSKLPGLPREPEPSTP